MLGALLLALFFAASPQAAWAEAGGPARFDTDTASRVFAAALSFMGPRTLDPISPAEATLWGLHGIAALDPGLAVNALGGQLVLTGPPASPGGAPVVLRRLPMPATADIDGWAAAAARLNAAAFDASSDLQRAGSPALVQSFFDEVFNHLDSYSRYVPPEPAEAARGRLALDASAGVTLIRRGGQIMISDVVPSGPGEAADLRVGDRLLMVAGSAIAGHSLESVRAMLTGEEGDTVNLTVRSLDGQTRRVTVVLAAVPPETVFASRLDGALMIQISAFTANTAERLSRAIENGLFAHPRAVVLDLRGNRGGLVRQAVTAVALFAESGTVASTAGRAPEATHAWRIDGGDLTGGLPVVVLVDGRTASAAEIMAAALADLGRGVVVGSATLGKGLVQTLTRLPDGGELFLTWSRVLAPRGWPLQSLGVLPQICTSAGQDDTYRQLDTLDAGTFRLNPAVMQARAMRAPIPPAQAVELRAACPAAVGSDLDLVAARFLTTHPLAYAQALLPSPPAAPAMPAPSAPPASAGSTPAAAPAAPASPPRAAKGLTPGT